MGKILCGCLRFELKSTKTTNQNNQSGREMNIRISDSEKINYMNSTKTISGVNEILINDDKIIKDIKQDIIEEEKADTKINKYIKQDIIEEEKIDNKINKCIKQDNFQKEKINNKIKKEIKHDIIQNEEANNQKEDENDSISIRFISEDNSIDFSLTCRIDDKFSNVKKKLYDKYPKLKNIGCYFICEEYRIKKSKTLKENNIKNRDKIFICYFDKEDKNTDQINIDCIYNNYSYPIVCELDDTINNIEEQLLDEYPELKLFKEMEFEFYHNNLLLSNKEKSLEDYAISNLDKIFISDCFITLMNSMNPMNGISDMNNNGMMNNMNNNCMMNNMNNNGMMNNMNNNFMMNNMNNNCMMNNMKMMNDQKIIQNLMRKNMNMMNKFDKNMMNNIDMKHNNKMIIRFKSCDQLDISIACSIDDKFSDVEKKLYSKCPELGKKGCLFLYNAKEIKKSKTLRQNGVMDYGRNTIIISYYYEELLRENKDYISIDIIYKDCSYPMVFKIDTKISDIKIHLSKEEEIENNCSFFYNGLLLSDEEKTLKDFGIKSGHKILLLGKGEFPKLDNENMEGKEEYIIVHFISTDQLINNAIKCKKFSPFHRIENKLYNQFPEIKNKNCFFLGNGNRIAIKKNLDENNIRNGDKIVIVIDEDDED